jgi:hypothetical protein
MDWQHSTSSKPTTVQLLASPIDHSVHNAPEALAFMGVAVLEYATTTEMSQFSVAASSVIHPCHGNRWEVQRNQGRPTARPS